MKYCEKVFTCNVDMRMKRKSKKRGDNIFRESGQNVFKCDF